MIALFNLHLPAAPTTRPAAAPAERPVLVPDQRPAVGPEALLARMIADTTAALALTRRASSHEVYSGD